ncbi:hypothetical protein KFZ58_07710 [Virgibacillus sp. NKC19-16]|uniref:hypothetical protein n=1 Tax=Virgibacillus salidurans TaxID=2831673 RepID=UPI001F1CDC3A|nr:hypothetical protein [Virgibacillus sp. NKC19-16]UJL47732.1 hypothetical protein KFZ58_07710 [Virgibacillus sp. NKC19-16]
MTTHFPALPHVTPYFPVYMIPYNTAVGHDWMKQPYWQEKPDDFVLAHNYPNQKKVNYINPKNYYSLS